MGLKEILEDQGPRVRASPLVVGHHEVHLPVGGLVDLVDGADVVVVEGRGSLRLLEEALLREVVAGQIGREDLHTRSAPTHRPPPGAGRRRRPPGSESAPSSY